MFSDLYDDLIKEIEFTDDQKRVALAFYVQGLNDGVKEGQIIACWLEGQLQSKAMQQLRQRYLDLVEQAAEILPESSSKNIAQLD